MVDVVAGTVATNYDTATSHTITVRETLAGALNSPRDTVLTINVTETVAFGPFTLAWTSAASELTNLSFSITPAPLAGDVVTLSLDGNSDMSSPFDTSDANTVDAGEVSAGTLTFTGIATPLSAGLTYARVNVVRGASNANSSIASITLTAPGDTTAPFLDLPTGVKTGSTTATLTVRTDEANGTLYGVNSAAAPSKAQIKLGQTSTGAASTYPFNQPVSTTGVQTKNATGLTASTTYTMHYMHEDTAGNQSNVASASSFTTDAAAGGWTSPLDATTPAVFWVDASNTGSITASGTEPSRFVSQWNDLGTGAHNLTPTGRGATTAGAYTSGVLNGKAGIAYGGSTEARTAVFTVPQPFMLVVVWKQSPIATDPFGILVDGDRDWAAASRAVLFTAHGAASGNYAPYAGTLVNQGVATAVNTAYHSRVVFNGASSSSVRNASNLTGISLGAGGVVNGIAFGKTDSTNTPQAFICEAFIIPYTAGNVATNAPIDATNAAAYTLAKWGV